MMLEGDLAHVRSILEALDQMNPETLKKALYWIETYEPQNDNNCLKTRTK